MSKEKYKEAVKVRKKVYYVLSTLGNTILEDPKIFLDKLLELSEFLEENKVPYFAKEQKDLIPIMLDYVRKLHGKVTGKFGIGIKKKQYFDNIEKKVVERLKLRYDPKFKLNSGIIIDVPEYLKKAEEKIEEVREGEKIEEKVDNENKVEEEVEIMAKKSSAEEQIKKRAERNVEETKEELSEELKHDEEIEGSITEDNLSEAK